MVLKTEIGEKLEQKFRKTAMQRYGYTKGALQKAAKDAIEQWVSQQPDNIPEVSDPFSLVEGILKKERGKKTSVELQREAKELWIKKHKKYL